MPPEKYCQRNWSCSAVEYFRRHRQVQTKNDRGTVVSLRENAIFSTPSKWISFDIWISEIQFPFSLSCLFLNSAFQFLASDFVEAPINVCVGEVSTTPRRNRCSSTSMEARWRKNMPSWCRSVRKGKRNLFRTLIKLNRILRTQERNIKQYRYIGFPQLKYAYPSSFIAYPCQSCYEEKWDEEKFGKLEHGSFCT